MKKHIIEIKRIKLEITIFDRYKKDDEDFDIVEIEITIPKDEWTRLIEEGNFSIYFDNVIRGYEKYIEEQTHCEVYVCFEEIE